MPYQNIRYAKAAGIATITLARPPANAMDLALCRELLDATIDATGDTSVRAVVVAGEGKAFCAGGDLSSFADAGDRAPALLMEMTTYLHAALSRLARMNAPVIAAVQGVAAGAGASLVAACDLAIASDSARFTMAYTQAGLTPDGSSTYFLPRLIGTRRAQELLLTNRVLSAAEAVEWGLINRAVPAADLDAEVHALASRLAAGPTLALGGVKRLLLLSDGDRLESQMEQESRLIAGSAATADGREGIAGFLEKRPPVFTGR